MKVGLVGAGFMGRAHVCGFATAARVFDLPITFELDIIADATVELAAAAQAAFGFARSTGDWRDLIADSEIAMIDITAPNALHKQIALAAIAAGKHVYCEKPLAPSLADALEMVTAAAAADVKTQVGFNYLKNPMFILAREMIIAGELGEIYSFRAIHAEDYMADPRALFTFRHDAIGGGALADIGSHVLATAEFLLGPIERVLGDCHTLISQRYDLKGRRHKVEVDDVTRAFLHFATGVSGSLEANWCATGRKMQHDFEVHGSKGSLRFSQEHLNELHYYSADDPLGRHGFRRIEAGPEHYPYGCFCQAPGHQLSFNDLKAMEIAGFADAIAGRAAEAFNFRAGYRIQRLVQAIGDSSSAVEWVRVED